MANRFGMFYNKKTGRSYTSTNFNQSIYPNLIATPKQLYMQKLMLNLGRECYDKEKSEQKKTNKRTAMLDIWLCTRCLCASQVPVFLFSLHSKEKQEKATTCVHFSLFPFLHCCLQLPLSLACFDCFVPQKPKKNGGAT